MKISDTLVYKKGTKPEQDATQAEVDEIIIYLWTIDQTEIDLNNNSLLTIRNIPTQQGLF
jgi:hypothetical protein